MSATDSTSSPPLGGLTVLPSSNSSSGSYPCFGAGGSADFALGFGGGVVGFDFGVAARARGCFFTSALISSSALTSPVGFAVRRVGSAVRGIGFAVRVGLAVGRVGSAVRAGLVVRRVGSAVRVGLAVRAGLAVSCVGFAVRVAVCWAPSRAAALRALARCGRMRGSAARIPPSGRESPSRPLGLVASLIVSQSSRTGPRLARYAISGPIRTYLSQKALG
jgi:hypothetical protein